MRITESQLRRIIRQEAKRLQESTSPGGRILMGELSASIAGDYRYTDHLKVAYDPSEDQVVVSVSQEAPAGGMDSFTGSSSFGRQDHYTQPDPRSVMETLSNVIQDRRYNFKLYGKPTKNFYWYGTREKGYSLRLIRAALDRARGQARPASR